MALRGSARFVVFVDDEDALRRANERFGAENVLAVSAKDLGPRVRRWSRATLEADVASVMDAHRARPFSRVVYWREPHVVIANRLAARLGLPSALDDPLLARDKLRMKSALRAAGVRCADCMPVTGVADLESAESRFLPGVLKPRYAFASICAVRVDDARSLRREFVEKRDKLVTTHIERVDLGVPAEPEFVLESFVGGTEHTVESFVANGEVTAQIVSDKLPMVPPHFVETGDLMPSALEDTEQDRLRRAARASIAALGVRQGWTHTEIKLLDGEPVVMEMGARMGGGYTPELVHAAYGLDMLSALFDYAVSGAAPSLGPARAVVLARRFVVSGASVVLDAGRAPNGAAGGSVTIVRRESARRRRGLLLGAPYSYEGTVAAYLIRARDTAELERLNAEYGPSLAPRVVELPLPRAWYRAYLAAKRRLDGFGRR